MQNDYEQKQSERKRQIKQKQYFLRPECKLFRTYKELFPSQKYPFEKVLSLWEIGPLHKTNKLSRQHHRFSMRVAPGMVPDARVLRLVEPSKKAGLKFFKP